MAPYHIIVRQCQLNRDNCSIAVQCPAALAKTPDTPLIVRHASGNTRNRVVLVTNLSELHDTEKPRSLAEAHGVLIGDQNRTSLRRGDPIWVIEGDEAPGRSDIVHVANLRTLETFDIDVSSICWRPDFAGVDKPYTLVSARYTKGASIVCEVSQEPRKFQLQWYSRQEMANHKELKNAERIKYFKSWWEAMTAISPSHSGRPQRATRQEPSSYGPGNSNVHQRMDVITNSLRSTLEDPAMGLTRPARMSALPDRSRRNHDGRSEGSSLEPRGPLNTKTEPRNFQSLFEKAVEKLDKHQSFSSLTERLPGFSETMGQLCGGTSRLRAAAKRAAACGGDKCKKCDKFRYAELRPTRVDPYPEHRHVKHHECAQGPSHARSVKHCAFGAKRPGLCVVSEENHTHCILLEDSPSLGLQENKDTNHELGSTSSPSIPTPSSSDMWPELDSPKSDLMDLDETIPLPDSPAIRVNDADMQSGTEDDDFIWENEPMALDDEDEGNHDAIDDNLEDVGNRTRENLHRLISPEMWVSDDCWQ